MDPGLCYGHCYPLHRVLAYFYGGVRTIHCSVDDQVAVEADQAKLGMLSGQGRLNSQCWFSVGGDADSEELVQVPQSWRAAGWRAGSRREPRVRSPVGTPFLQSLLDAGKIQPVRSHSCPQHATFRRTRLPVVQGVKPESPSRRKTMDANAAKGGDAGTRSASPGTLMPDDVFFWFCHGSLSPSCFPTNSTPVSPESLVFRYSDFVSRTGTPEPPTCEDDDEKAMDALSELVLEEDKPLPPSITLRQPTVLPSHVRKRWEVKTQFVDDEGLILGDRGWMPGSLGHRFTYEASTADVSLYIGLTEVPQARLLYYQCTSEPSEQHEIGGSDTALLDGHLEEEPASRFVVLPQLVP